MTALSEDLTDFLEKLKNMRLVDDRIIYELNSAIPSKSFLQKVDAKATCRNLFQRIVESHLTRDDSLRQCLDATKSKVQNLTEQRKSNPNDPQILKLLRREQTQLRELQIQMNVEEVIRGRTIKIYQERCRKFYRPADGEYPLE